ncbi:hypothetical protein ACFQY7_00595 [Actinomadura luteofluorescens]|uniref:hypothetical protein n=1 Tax=Actinomadura luteofluorescens TaxID=46163 RepID=UPI003638C393
MNRRGNGLSAETYAPLVDLAPHLADAMLSALGEAGVAAYAASPSGLPEIAEAPAEPVAGDVLDRLYVDVEMKPAAEGILRVHLARLREASARGSDGEHEGAELNDADLLGAGARPRRAHRDRPGRPWRGPGGRRRRARRGRHLGRDRRRVRRRPRGRRGPVARRGEHPRARRPPGRG